MMESWQTNLSPAPWRGDHGEIYDAKDNVVVFMAVDGERFNHANESLIAAAPELLEALKILRTQFGDYKDGDGATKFHACNIADAAIAKAEGRTE